MHLLDMIYLKPLLRHGLQIKRCWRIGFSFNDINEYEVLKIVKDINISKSSAYDKISTRPFKNAFTILIREITYLFNRCISEGSFPIEWGLAEDFCFQYWCYLVTPILKAGDLKIVKIWRLISQIKLPGKLLERLIHN